MKPSQMINVDEAFTNDPKSINKFEMVRHVLTILNEEGDGNLTVRRHLLRRVVEFEDFTRCSYSPFTKYE